MQKITAKTSKIYDIIIDAGLLCECGRCIADVIHPCKAMIVSDTNVAPIYMGRVKASLEKSGFETFDFVFPAGEKSKTYATVYDILTAMADAKLTRNDIVVALGGGVVGDLSGFASAVYMRGIRFVQLPTSLLADIDSSVGGKTGCDMPCGKNLIGAFHQPELVLIDTLALKTLPEKYFNDGMGEAIKYGVIRSKRLFDDIAQRSKDERLDDLISECVDIKCEIVERDETECGERKLLNFGHTLGHAIEKYYGFDKYSHGEAVAIGMVMISAAAARNGFCDKTVSEDIAAVCKKYSLPTECDAPLKELIKVCFNDKKRTNGGIDLIVPERIGKCIIRNVADDQLYDRLKKD